MSEKNVIGLVVAGAVALSVVIMAGLLISANAKTRAREQETAAAAAELGNAIFKSDECIHDREFDRARSTLRTIEPRLSVASQPVLTEQFNEAWQRIVVAEREYSSRVKQGWTMFEDEFISPEEKEMILAERKRQGEEELRLAEEERRLAEARLEKERAERQLEEVRRIAQEASAVEERRKAMEPTAIMWSEYIADCGVIAQRDNEARSEYTFKNEYRGKRVRWSGRVVNVDTTILGGGFTIRVKMEPGDESIHSDILLNSPISLGPVVIPLNEHDPIEFVGILESQGGVFSDHVIDAEQIIVE